MLISNLIENSNVRIMTLEECSYELTINSMLFENKLLEAENKLMETQMLALNDMMMAGETLSENTSKLQLIQEGAIGNFLTSIKNMLISIAKKIKEIWNSIFKSDKKSSNEVSTSVSNYNDKTKDVLKDIKNSPLANAVDNISKVEASVKVLDMRKVSSKFNLNNAHSIIKQCINKFDNLDKHDKESLDDCLLDCISEFSDKIGISDGNFSETRIKEDISNNMMEDVQIGLSESHKALDIVDNNSKIVDKLEKQSISIIGSFLCTELDKLPSNKDISKISKDGINTSDNSVENIIIRYKSNFISKAAGIINNIINAIIKVHVANKRTVGSANLSFSRKMLVAVSGKEALKKHDEEWKKMMEDPNYVLVI